ncbi:MAG: transcriptional regulator [Syntrophobacteraceae bacterium CG23_combo_of_CG06-09_8_20_14_all_50_8]|nr:MAG: transcriptional regulator [Syntrophobacteraceae bacterium CG23_combo_of_CG06-09_8_20_14_all_50_8]
MPEICRFFGIIIRMFFDEHDPPHFHAEYQGGKAVFDFNGNVMKGSLNSKTATKLVREWIDLRLKDLEEDWELARAGKEVKKIAPLE